MNLKIKYLFASASLFASICQAHTHEHSKKSFWDDSYWEKYYQETLNVRDPCKTLSLACRYFEMESAYPGRSVDLGAGTGAETLFLLESGWRVLALDSQQRSIDIILDRAKDSLLSNLTVAVSPFSEMTLPKELNLVNASRTLPFCHPDDFSKCWETIVDSLAVGGRFCGQFYGKHDYLAANPEATTLTHDEVIELFKDRFTIEYLQIEDGLLPCSDGKMYPCHNYHVVAKKIKK